ncbi:hypothetical protein C2E21_4642 [Chlorella sorokiniana]|uniref:Uncharacterized protein n=1 Tax=Chlorella sorokiniana TaxID=3076 RepID=A0A2P6TQW9_CHLSO|nr:hypothetical protein C2E21_4642 [Chlorella sorokiniana]|eukprot:PRW56459.1 hypothetical protein C2E21_4642 [Chlorella sorokiniana]
MLRLRCLSTLGSEAEQQQRLAAYLSDPSGFPEARCERRSITLLGGRLFAGQSTLRTHVQLLMNILLGDEVREGHPDFAFLLALLQQHPRYAEKVQPPVVAFRVQVIEDSDLQPLRFFEFLDARGQWEDFSYRKCIGMRADHNAELSFRDAMRYAITDQLQAFRLASTKTGLRGQQVHICDCCGKRVRDGRQLRVVHNNPSFRQVVRDFCATTSLPRPPVDGTVPGSKRRCITDEAWLAAWRSFHRKNVRLLQLACYPCAKARNAAEDKADESGHEEAEQPAEQQWQAWTVPPKQQAAQQQQDVQSAAPSVAQQQPQAKQPQAVQQMAQPQAVQPVAPGQVAQQAKLQAEQPTEQQAQQRKVAGQQQAAPRKTAPRQPAFAPDAFESAETDAWLGL